MEKLRRRLRYAAYALLSFSLFSYLFYALGGFNKEYSISAKNAFVRCVDDKTQGGNTHSEIDISGQSLVLNCDIGDKGKWPYCEIAIDLSKTTKGLDLSNFHSVGIDVDYFSPIEGERIRVYLRNYDPAYSSQDDPVSLKFNAIEYAPGIDQGLTVIPLKAFQVLSWWIAEYELPIETSGPQFDNILQIEIATGSYIKQSHYTIQLNRLVFYGEWISEEMLLRFNTSLWVLAAACFLFVERRRLNHQLREMVAKAEFLKDANESLHEQSLKFEELAYTDSLTGAQNRHAVDCWLQEVIGFSKHNGHAFSMAYIDIDFFKTINDTYGHKVGDEVLKEFARVLNLRARKTDVVVRWGGEEFIVFCPATDLRGITEFADMIRTIIENYQWTEGLNLTCSIGLAEYMPGESIDTFIQRADRALYKAKRQGRNRVEAAS
ncbi:GGDEF domain-containing protein [Photobacterium aphoticum]|nr:GGDEF domain-containing protein [Photobacterium aphoticum]GHA58156.1 GGDEF domain-containing protein [Photobacterium aphoticum]